MTTPRRRYRWVKNGPANWQLIDAGVSGHNPYRVAGVVAAREDEDGRRSYAYHATRDRGFPGATTVEGATATREEARQIVHEHVTADDI